MSCLTDEEMMFSRYYAESGDPVGSFLRSFSDAELIPSRFLWPLVAVLLDRNEIRLEIYVQQRLLAERPEPALALPVASNFSAEPAAKGTRQESESGRGHGDRRLPAKQTHH